MPRPPRRHARLAAAALCSCSLAALAAEGGGLRFSGFGTVGATHVDAPAGWGYRRDAAQAADTRRWRADVDSRLGLQANYQPDTQFDFVGQVLLARRSPHAKAGDALAWALAAWRPLPDVAVRAGRLNIDQFQLSDYRNVGFAYLPVRPAVEFYGDLPSSLDGADVTRTLSLDDAQWRLKAFGGQVRIQAVDDRPAERWKTYGVSLARESDGITVRAAVSRAQVPAASGDTAAAGAALGSVAALPVAAVADEARQLQQSLAGYVGSWLTYAGAGLTVDRGAWVLSLEVARVTGHASAASSTGLATLGYRWGDWTPYLQAAGAHSKAEAVATPQWQAVLTPLIGAMAAAQVQGLGSAVAGGLNSARTAQESYSLGVRWNVRPSAALKAQVDRVRIGADGGRRWLGATRNPGNATVASTTLDFVF